MLKDWKQTYLGETLIKYENKENNKFIFAVPERSPRNKWVLVLPDGRRINYRGKREVKKAMMAYMRTH